MRNQKPNPSEWPSTLRVLSYIWLFLVVGSILWVGISTQYEWMSLKNCLNIELVVVCAGLPLSIIALYIRFFKKDSSTDTDKPDS